MDAAQLNRDAEKSRLLKRLAELLVEEQRAAGVFERTPHFSQLEDACHGLGQEVAQASLVRAAREGLGLHERGACEGLHGTHPRA